MIQSPAGYQGDVRIKRYLDFYQAGYGVAMLSSGTTAFTPASLFAASEPGGWYDPSDLTTLYQDAAGTTPVTAVEQPVGLVLDKSGRGNHLSQSTAAARPVLSARVNLLTYTEQFDNAAWTKTGLNAFGSGSVANTNVTTDPLGGNTADFIQENSANTTHEVNATYASTTGVTYTCSVYVKAAGRNWCVVTTGVAGAWFNLSNGTVGTTQAGCTAAISSAGNGWYLCRVTVAETAGSPTRTPRIYIANADNVVTYTGDGTSGVYIWGADLRPANAGVGLPSYQRVGAATDYDTTGFPLYLRADGVDDRLIGPTISNLISASAYEACMGARVLAVSTSNASPWLNQSLVADAGGYVGIGYMTTSNVIGAFNYDGTSDTATQPMTPPSTFVLQQRHDGGNIVLSLNGGAEASAASGNTTNLSFETRVFSSNGSTSVQAHIYGLVIRSTAFTAAERANLRAWMNSKTKAF